MPALSAQIPPPRQRRWSLNSRATRGLLVQLIAVALIALVLWFLAQNTQRNMAERGIQSGFDFLGSSAGFDIGETLIAYDPSETYGKAIWVGVLNTLLALPYVVINVSAGLRSYDMTQEQAACILGATRLRAFFDVTLPQIRFSVIAAAMFAFAISLDEAVISLFISGGDSSTLTKRMFSSLRSEIDPLIAVVATLMTLLSITMLCISIMAQRKAKRAAA